MFPPICSYSRFDWHQIVATESEAEGRKNKEVSTASMSPQPHRKRGFTKHQNQQRLL